MKTPKLAGEDTLKCLLAGLEITNDIRFLYGDLDYLANYTDKPIPSDKDMLETMSKNAYHLQDAIALAENECGLNTKGYRDDQFGKSIAENLRDLENMIRIPSEWQGQPDRSSTYYRTASDKVQAIFSIVMNAAGHKKE